MRVASLLKISRAVMPSRSAGQAHQGRHPLRPLRRRVPGQGGKNTQAGNGQNKQNPPALERSPWDVRRPVGDGQEPGGNPEQRDESRLRSEGIPEWCYQAPAQAGTQQLHGPMSGPGYSPLGPKGRAHLPRGHLNPGTRWSPQCTGEAQGGATQLQLSGTERRLKGEVLIQSLQSQKGALVPQQCHDGRPFLAAFSREQLDIQVE